MRSQESESHKEILAGHAAPAGGGATYAEQSLFGRVDVPGELADMGNNLARTHNVEGTSGATGTRTPASCRTAYSLFLNYFPAEGRDRYERAGGLNP